jgi:cytochrome c oxidase subunit 3
MATSALDAAPVVVDVEPRRPDGGGPGQGGYGDGWGGDGNNDGGGNPESLYRLGALLTVVWVGALFAALVTAFWFRSRTPFMWQAITSPRALWLSTAVLGASSWMLELSRQALSGHRWFAYRRRLLLTIYLGLGFIACQGAGIFELMRQGFYLRGDPHSSVFYVFTGAHGLHVAGGMAALNYLLFCRGKNWRQHTALLSASALYWHFLGVLWLVLFGFLLAW